MPQPLPTALSCEAVEFTLARALVPADSVGGDTYDYVLVLDRDTVHLSITDAMGHDTSSAPLATIAVNASHGVRRACPARSPSVPGRRGRTAWSTRPSRAGTGEADCATRAAVTPAAWRRWYEALNVKRGPLRRVEPLTAEESAAVKAALAGAGWKAAATVLVALHRGLPPFGS